MSWGSARVALEGNDAAVVEQSYTIQVYSNIVRLLCEKPSTATTKEICQSVRRNAVGVRLWPGWPVAGLCFI